MAMLPRIKPRTFYDLVIEVAIVRPGPIQGGPERYPSDLPKPGDMPDPRGHTDQLRITPRNFKGAWFASSLPRGSALAWFNEAAKFWSGRITRPSERPPSMRFGASVRILDYEPPRLTIAPYVR